MTLQGIVYVVMVGVFLLPVFAGAWSVYDTWTRRR